MKQRTLTPEGLAEIERIALERIRLPSDKELSHRHKISRSYVQLLMAAVRRRLKTL